MTMTSPSGSSIDEAQAFLNAHPEVEAFDIVLHDSNGIGRGKIIRRQPTIRSFLPRAVLPVRTAVSRTRACGTRCGATPSG